MKQIKAATGVELPLADRAVGSTLRAFTAENVALIESMGQRYLDQVERLIVSGVAEGRRWEDLAVEIEDRFDVAESSAQLIARDQVGKAYGAINEVRQTELGIEGYVWRTVQDQRVRDEHRALEGQHFSWDDPPEDGHPGEPVSCRCWAEPDFSEILGDE